MRAKLGIDENLCPKSMTLRLKPKPFQSLSTFAMLLVRQTPGLRFPNPEPSTRWCGHQPFIALVAPHWHSLGLDDSWLAYSPVMEYAGKVEMFYKSFKYLPRLTRGNSSF
ncbi:hypothetical protein RRG08_061736 [Elysia crispata]|uniref:Uncharacterized protein n=1 Tax=Elysia crispata TaxID=231223 RepID=A0AAE1DTI4_9GAST|nr:hypothetical protein RRG08_061736 [Elysia crispata]